MIVLTEKYRNVIIFATSCIIGLFIFTSIGKNKVALDGILEQVATNRGTSPDLSLTSGDVRIWHLAR